MYSHNPNLLLHKTSKMYGNSCCHPKLFLDCISIITNINMMKYIDSNDISMMLSIMLLNGLTNPKYIKYTTCNMNKKITASGPLCCPQIIVNVVNMYFLIKLTDRNDFDMFSLKYGHILCIIKALV